MSDAPNPTETRKELPGCGLAAFAFVLLGIFLAGVAGIVFSTHSMLTSGVELSPSQLSYGGEVDARLLAPMRQAGLLGPTEIPDAFHPENADGSRACALSGGKVLRLDGTTTQSMPIASITSVEGSDTEVVIHGETTIVCPFEPGQGAEQLRRMLTPKASPAP